MKEGNANFVRGAHYPQDQRWLDRLDEGGFAMWEETLGPGVSLNDTQDWSHFMKYQLQQVEEMLEASMNHPSIMVWAWFNEGPSDNQAACPAYAACAKVAGKDPTRFLSWASSKQQRDQCLEHATAVSFNGYPAWYSDQHQLDVPARFWSENAAWVKEHYPEKPFFISETGAGGLFEWDKNTTDAYWTLKYQQEVIDRDVDVALTDTNVSGLTLWHFFDFKGNDEAQACGPCHYEPHQLPPVCAWYNMTGSCSRRPGGVNHKGVVDLYRRKKPSFESVKAKYGSHGSHGSRLTRQIMVWRCLKPCRGRKDWAWKFVRFIRSSLWFFRQASVFSAYHSFLNVRWSGFEDANWPPSTALRLFFSLWWPPGGKIRAH